MIDLDPADIVLTRRAADGRFVIFTATDVRPGWPLRWWGAVADTGGDGFGFLVRLDAETAPAGWTAWQLLAVVQRRMADEAARLPLPMTLAAVASLDQAAASLAGMMGNPLPDDPVTFASAGGGELSPYARTVARSGDFQLPLCPDPESFGEGIAPEQLLIVLDQLLHDTTNARPHERAWWTARRHVAAALAAEAARVIAVRAGSGHPPPG